jgi:chromosomal replication initiator protein
MRTSFDVNFSKWPEIWQAAYKILHETGSMTHEQLRNWIDPIDSIRIDSEGETLLARLECPNDWSTNWIKDRFRSSMESALQTVTGRPCRIELFTRVRTPEETPVGAILAQEALAPPFQNTSPPSRATVLQTGVRSAQRAIDARYTFDNFVIGASNQFAYASAYAVANRPGAQYNPLFLYSQPGLGKTHLLHAIANQVMTQNPTARVCYISAESFMNELIESIQHQKMPSFRAKYRDGYDVLLMDDVQFIAGKTSTEEEFFHTFNALHSSKKQIVISSDRPPKDIEKLEERIRTRFEWGLVSDIQPPEIETRIAILKAKAERDDVYLPDDVATFLATHVKNNVRALEGVLVKLKAQSSLTGAEISLEMAKSELKSSIPEENSQITVETIQATVAKYFQIKIQDLKSTSKKRTFSLPRQIAFYLVRKYTGLGFKEIGQYFGGKDHSTVVYGCDQIEQAVESNPETRNTVESIQNLL